MTSTEKNSKGFSLIELLVVFTILAILSVIGVVDFVTYDRYQRVNTTAADIATTLQNARAKALSQVKPSICKDHDTNTTSNQFQGYKVMFTVDISDPNNKVYQYSLFAVCSDVSKELQQIVKKTLPKYMTFAILPSNGQTIFFHALTAGVELLDLNDAPVQVDNNTGTQITVSGYGQSKQLKVFSDGRISYTTLTK